MEITEKVLGSSKHLETYQSDQDNIESPLNKNSRHNKSKSVAFTGVSNENYEEIRKKMENDLENLKKMQMKLNGTSKKTYISDTTRSRLKIK